MDEREGSFFVGSESEPGCGAQPVPIEVATKIGTIITRERL
jgi:hypothetical protein